MKFNHSILRQCRVLLVVLSAWTALGTVSRAYAAGDVFTPAHVAKLRTVMSAKIAPDGTLIAYTLSVPRIPFKDDDGAAWTELHVVDLDGNSRPFVTGEVNVRDIKWTPDGLGISFLAKREGDEHKSLYVIPIDGGEARNMLSHETDIGEYAWSPDGNRVAFIAADKEDKDVKKLEDKGIKAEVYEEDYRQKQLWIGEPWVGRGNDDEDDEDRKPRVIELKGTPSGPEWSPDGKLILLAIAPTPLIDDTYMQRRLRVIDADTGETAALIDNAGKLGAYKWSPDGKKIALLSGEDINDPSEGRLMVVPATGGVPKDLLPGFLGEFTSIAWQNNQTIMYLADQGVWTTIGEIGVDGSNQKVHVEPGGLVATGMSLAKHGQTAAMVSSAPKHPGEVFVSSHGAVQPKRLTDSNPWLADMRFARQEPIQYNARDGERIEGIVFYPLDYDAGTRYPLILSVHGGPEAHETNGWLTGYGDPGQVGSAEGYAVLYLNYRGSTGRGVAFQKAHQADYAGKEFNDLVDGVEYLVELGLVDRDRVGVTGGSYGGFATAWCATALTEHFAAAVMFVGISDHISKFGTTDIPNEMYLVHARKWPWGNWDWFRERSPVYYTEQAKTPILIMHGKNDTRVHPSQSMELYRYLKTLGKVPVRLVFYPGEGHGNRKAAARLDYNRRMMRWFDHYLKGPGGDPPPYELDYSEHLKDKEEDEDKDATDEEDAPTDDGAMFRN